MFVLCNIKTSSHDQLKIKVIMGSVPLNPTPNQLRVALTFSFCAVNVMVLSVNQFSVS